MNLKSKIKSAAITLGFDLVSVAPYSPPPEAPHLLTWLQTGNARDMGWMNRDPERRQDPRIYWSPGKSILSVGMRYHQDWIPWEMLNDPSRGRIATYAWGQDYHDLMIPRLKALASTISYLANRTIQARWYVDTGALLEKPIAQMGNMGFQGKNTLLIHSHDGSYYFLGELLLDIELEADPPQKVQFGCGECHRCADHCPTGALDQPYILETGKCISYLTIENRGAIPRHLRSKMGNWIYGCDICQTSCPYNARNIPTTNEAWFRPADAEYAAPKLTELIQLDETAFRRRFRGSAIKRTKRRGLLRNVAVALGNWGSEEATPILERVLEDEPEALIREHSVWALGQIKTPTSRRILERALSSESNLEVQKEIEWVLERS
ncbi:tRNA epoxyqueuosine(34) reductase QueG [bacterium]|nr:tRNA epoxyqueuosine(34) reductase QueG [bacterium]